MRAVFAVNFRSVLFWAAALFAFVMACMPQGPQIPGISNDKVQHIIAFVTLAILAIRAFVRTPLRYILVGLSAYGALIEIVQAIPALHRDSDWKDWAADSLAVAAVCLASFCAARIRLHAQ
ncbi:MAG TPA: hypothetical protein VFT61_06310 [Sphingomicrobium sp.]|nr:hypothetical protein [Sphingomicrobium sp.]